MGKLPGPAEDFAFEYWPDRPMVEGAERVNAAVRSAGNDAGNVPCAKSHEFAEKAEGKRRHIARHHQVPIGSGGAERRKDSTHGTISGKIVGDHAHSPLAMFLRAAHDPNRDHESGEHIRNPLHKAAAVNGQQALVLAHAAAASAREDEPARSADGCRRSHEKMLAFMSLAPPLFDRFFAVIIR